jgi:hypothetical protein
VSYIYARLDYERTQQQFNILNYVDVFAGAEVGLNRAQISFNMLAQLLSDIGLIESKSKACPPSTSTSMVFLGVKFDTVNVCMQVDDEKVTVLRFELAKRTKGG